MSSIQKISLTLFIIFISIIPVSMWLSQDQIYSEKENRSLQQFPSFSFQKFFSGEYTKQFEDYMNDQFIAKDFWLTIKSKSEQLLLKRENNGIYYGKDGFLLERYNQPNEQLKNNIALINYFAEKMPTISTTFLLVPNSVEVYKDKLPLFAPSYSQQAVINTVNKNLDSKVKLIDPLSRLEMYKDEYIYFKTDHHWTMRGAFRAYELVMQELGIQPYKLKDFDIEEVSKTFYGTYFSKVNNNRIKPDTMEVFKPTFPISYNVEINQQKKKTSLYDEEYLNKRDQYSYYLNGNNGLVKIKTNLKNGRKIAVLKDSYAHVFIPLLANHYEEVHVIDLRYNHSNVYAYIEQNQIEQALFLYNIASFSTDSNLIWLKQ